MTQCGAGKRAYGEYRELENGVMDMHDTGARPSVIAQKYSISAATVKSIIHYMADGRRSDLIQHPRTICQQTNQLLAAIAHAHPEKVVLAMGAR